MIDETITESANDIERSADDVLAEAAESSRILDDTEENFSSEKLEHAEKAEDFVSRMTDLPDGIYECAITTVDNPFDPIDEFDQWFSFDEEKGYHTCSYLGRIVDFKDTMSDEEMSKEIERAIDEILDYDFLGIYKKVKRPAREEESPSSSSLAQSDLNESSEEFQNLEPVTVDPPADSPAAPPEGG